MAASTERITINGKLKAIYMWQGDEYLDACKKATKKGYQKSSAFVARKARKIAPVMKYKRYEYPHKSTSLLVSSQHKIKRSYGNKRYWLDHKPINDSIRPQTKQWADTGNTSSMVKVKKAGYATFVSYGHRVTTPGGRRTGRQIRGRPFLMMALAESYSKIIELLKKEWPN